MTHATSAADLPDLDTMRAMSGLDFVQGIRAGELPDAPIGQVLNFALAEAEEGRVTYEGAPRSAHMNPMGGIHGGWYGAVLDSAMGCAVMTKVPRGSTWTTLELKVNIVRAVPCDMQVRAIGTTIHAGRTTIVATGEIRGKADDRLFASASTTCLVRALPER